MNECCAELAGFEEMIRIAGAGLERELAGGESFVNENSAGTEGALHGGKERALEVAKAKDYVEGSGGEREGFEVGFDEEEFGVSAGERAIPTQMDATRGSECGGAVEGGGRDVNGGDLPAERGEMDGILPCPAGEVEGAAMRKEREGLEEEGIGLRCGMEGRVGVAGVPSVGGGRHGGNSKGNERKEERIYTEGTRSTALAVSGQAPKRRTRRRGKDKKMKEGSFAPLRMTANPLRMTANPLKRTAKPKVRKAQALRSSG
jgi:hypothetical protein